MLTYQPCPQTAVRLHDAQQNDDERRGLWRDKAFSWRLERRTSQNTSTTTMARGMVSCDPEGPGEWQYIGM